VRWGRAGLMRELLGKTRARARICQRPWRWPQPRQQRQGAFECLLERGRPAAAEAVAEAVQCALQCALEQRCVAIDALLLSRRASLSQVSLPGLFTCASVSDATSAALTTSAYLGVPHDAAQLLRERPLELSRRPMPDVRGGRASFSFVECMHKLTMAPSSSGTREDVRPFVGVAGAVV